MVPQFEPILGSGTPALPSSAIAKDGKDDVIYNDLNHHCLVSSFSPNDGRKWGYLTTLKIMYFKIFLKLITSLWINNVCTSTDYTSLIL